MGGEHLLLHFASLSGGDAFGVAREQRRKAHIGEAQKEHSHTLQS